MESYQECAGKQKKKAKTILTSYNKRYDVSDKNRMSVANAAKRVRSMANGVLLFPKMEVRRQYGIDGGKKVKGRKHHIVVDTLGLLMATNVHSANIHDSVGTVDTIKLLQYVFPRQKQIIADGGYRGKLADTVKGYGWDLSVTLRRS